MALTQGDIAFVGMNTAGGPDDWLAFVALNNIAAGEVIYFSDNELTSASATSFNTGESYTKWTAPAGGVAAGTVVKLTNWDLVASVGTSIIASVGTAAPVTFTGSTNRGLSTTADSVYAYTATGDSTANTPVTHLAYINLGAGTTSNGAGTGTDGFAPASLGANYQFSNTAGADSAIYTGTHSG